MRIQHPDYAIFSKMFTVDRLGPTKMLVTAVTVLVIATVAIFVQSPTVVMAGLRQVNQTATPSATVGTAPLIVVKYGDIWAWDPATARLRQLTWHNYVFPPVLSPDGKYLAFLVAPYANLKHGIDFGRSLWLLEVTTGREVQLSEPFEVTLNAECPSCIPQDTQWINAPVWSTDSQALFWISYKMHRDETGFPHTTDDTVWMLNPTTGQRQKLTRTSAEREEVGHFGLAVSPKEKKLAWIKLMDRGWNPNIERYDTSLELVIHNWGTGSQILRDLPPIFQDAAGLGRPIVTLWEEDGLGLFYDGPAYNAHVFIYDSQGKVIFSYYGDGKDAPKGAPTGDGAIGLFGELRWYRYGTHEYFGSVMGPGTGGTRNVLIDLPSSGIKVIDQDVAVEYYSRRAATGSAIRRSYDGVFVVDNQGKSFFTLPDDVFNPPHTDIYPKPPRWAVDPGGQRIAFTTKGQIKVWDSATGTITAIDTFGPTEETQPRNWAYDGALAWGQIDRQLHLIDR
jgi:hypothetical protein